MSEKTNERGGRNASAPRLPRLSKRLAAVAALVPEGTRVADIGTDHGHLAVWLYLHGAPAVTAADINPGPLDSARRTAAEYGISDKLTFALSDGFKSLDTASFDAAVIAGMGGETIANIISALSLDDRRRITLILQPQSKSDELCSALKSWGYGLIDADIVKDVGRVYITFSVKWQGQDAKCEPLSLLASKGGELISEYIRSRIRLLERELEGHTISGRDAEAQKVTGRLEYLRRLGK